MQEAQDDVLQDETGTCLNETAKKDALRISDVTGGHGPWQFRHWAIFFLASACNSMHLFSTLPLMVTNSCQCFNVSENKAVDFPKPVRCNVSACSAITNQMPWEEMNDPCFLPIIKNTFVNVEEMDEQCSNIGIVIYAKLLYVLGSLIATITVYPLMRRFGRRSVSLISCFLLSACSLATSWAIAPASYLILRFIISMGINLSYLIAAFSLMECIGKDFRLLYFYTGHISWGFSHFILPLFIWMLADWMPFNIILSIPCFLLLILVCFLPESAESYASKGLWTRAHKVMRTAARCNGYSVQSIEQFSQNYALPQRKEDRGFSLVWKRDNYRLFLELGALFVIGFLSSFTYFTSIWLTDWMKGKRGSYFSLLGTTEVASVLILLFFSYFFPVKRLWGLTSFMSSIFLILMYIKASKDTPAFSRGPFITEMFFASAAWTIFLMNVLSQPFDSKESKLKTLTSGIGICIGLLAATLADLQKLMGWSRNIFLIMGVPNLFIGACIGFIPNRYLLV